MGLYLWIGDLRKLSKGNFPIFEHNLKALGRESYKTEKEKKE